MAQDNSELSMGCLNISDHYGHKKRMVLLEAWADGVTDADIAYIAGIVDGEGCIYASWRYGNKSYNDHVKMTVTFTCNMTDKPVLEFISSKFDSLKVVDTKGTKRQAYRINIGGAQKLKLFLTKLLPYLIAKRKVAELALKIIETFSGRECGKVSEKNINIRTECWNKLRYSNHFSPGNKVHDYPK